MLMSRFDALAVKKKGCWEWLGDRAKNGRPRFRVAGMWVVAARLSYELYVAQVPDGMHVCHQCDNAGCVNPEHLWLGSHADNMADAAKKGRMNRGEQNHFAKLTEDAVKEVIRLYATGNCSQVELGRRFGVSHSIISGIVSGDRWGYLGVALPKASCKGRGSSGDKNGARLHPDRLARGEKHPNCKLTPEQVSKIRLLATEGQPQRALGKLFGVGQSQIGRILRGESRRV